MAPKTLVIVNPKSRGGRHERSRNATLRALRAALAPFDLAYTKAPRDAARLAREGALSGAQRIVVAGGDGTASEVVSGLLEAAIGDRVEVGLLPLGTGRDFARGLGIRAGVSAAIEVIAAGRSERVDAGRVAFRDRCGAEQHSFFVNVGSVGLSAAIVGNVDSGAKARWGPIAFAAGFAKTLRSWGSSCLDVSVDGETFYRGNLDLVAVANGVFFGGGMKLAPDARLDDGLFDVVAVRPMSRVAWLCRMPSVYRGRHVALDDVFVRRGRVVEIAPAGASAVPTPIELDGEPVGRAPVRFEMLPAALRVLVPAPR